MFREIARLIDKRFDIYIEPPTYCATQYVGEIMRTVSEKWDEFTDADRAFIKTILEVDDSVRPVDVGM
jgi:hypothetical protein